MMRNPCKECDYYHEENNTCQSKKCCTGGDGYITWIDRLFCKPYKYTADRKTENSSEIPNNSTCSKMEQVDKDINVRSKTEPQTSCKTCCYGEVDEGYVRCAYYSKSTEQDEPQTDTEIAKAIVHKMIDDAVIAEDAYPDLRQRMHDAVDNYEPQTEVCDDCIWRVRNYNKAFAEPQTCSVNGRPYDCGNCEHHKCTADEPQTERRK